MVANDAICVASRPTASEALGVRNVCGRMRTKRYEPPLRRNSRARRLSRRARQEAFVYSRRSQPPERGAGEEAPVRRHARMTPRTLAPMLATALTVLCLPAAAGAANVADNQVATSFDGTKIVYTLMTPDNASSSNRVPAVLITHGWGGSRQTTPNGFAGDLLASGYAVLTWDQRGFGESGGQVEVDDPQVEARDVSALVDVLARDPRIARNGPGDPKVGMSGGSYAGGIQWVTAARDHRIDAIAPEISWHNLLESLIPSGVVKTGWGVALFGAGETSVTGGLN